MTSMVWLLVFGLMAQPVLAVTVDVRIEGPRSQIWQGTVNTTATKVTAAGGNQIEVSANKAASAIETAAKSGDFNTEWLYDSGWDAYFLSSIASVSPVGGNYWNYRYNYRSDYPFVTGLVDQIIQNGDSLLFFYGPWPYPPPLKIDVSTNNIKENENISISASYFDDASLSFKPVQATVYIGNSQLDTDANGNLTTPISKAGVYNVYADKTGYVRSEKKQFTVGNVLSSQQANNAIKKALNFLRKKQVKDGRIENPGVSAWAAIAFASAGVDPQAVIKTKGMAKKNQRSLIDYLKQYTKSELTKRKSKKKAKKSAALATDYARQIMAVHASGLNPRNFAGVNLVKQLASYFKNDQFGNSALVNDDIFALIAYRAGHVNSNDPKYRKAISFVLKNQHSDGSFNYSTSSNTGEIDTTAAAIQALVLAKKAGIVNLDDAINKAYSYLEASQNDDGGFGYNSSFKTSNGQSTSWTTLAVAAAKGSSAVDSLTSSKGSNPVYFTSTLQKSNGGFSYSQGGLSDVWTTTQVIPALAKKPWLTRINKKIKKKGKK